MTPYMTPLTPLADELAQQRMKPKPSVFTNILCVRALLSLSHSQRDYGYGFSNGLHQFFVTIEDVDDNFLYDRRER